MTIKWLWIAAILLPLETISQSLVGATKLTTAGTFEMNLLLSAYGWNTAEMSLNGATNYKIVYNTVDVHGNPTVASGALFVPDIDCDTVPLVAYCHGTEFDRNNVPSQNQYLGQGGLYAGNGYLVVIADYLGLGDNPGIHPYHHWESQATATVDLIRAAREFLIDSLEIWDNNQLFLSGYSQGGHAAMSVQKYIQDNNLQSEFNVVGSAPMSGAYYLSGAQTDFVFDADSSYDNPEFLPYLFASYQLVYGDLYGDYDAYYDQPYDSLIEAYLTDGTYSGSQWNALLPGKYFNFMQDSVLINSQSLPNHAINRSLRKNNLHNWKPDMKTRMLYCGGDVTVSPQNSVAALDSMTALGATDVRAIEVDENATHSTCFQPAMLYSLNFFDSLKTACEWVSGVEQQAQEFVFKAYPNPTSGIVYLEFEKEISEITVNQYSASGQRLQSLKFQNAGKTPVQLVGEPGLYFVEVISDKDFKTLKVFKR